MTRERCQHENGLVSNQAGQQQICSCTIRQVVRGKAFIIKVGGSRIRTTHTPTHSGRPSHPMLQVLIHDAGVRTRALSLRANTLKRCIDYGDYAQSFGTNCVQSPQIAFYGLVNLTII